MKLELRPPRSGEWQICRMLLPETFPEVDSREYLLCLRDETPRIVAAASWQRLSGTITGLRIHVVPAFRRLGVGSHIVDYLAGSGISALEGTADIIREPKAAAFCERNSLHRVDGMTIVETENREMRDYLRRLRSRFPLPANAKIIPLSAAPFAEVARLHAAEVVHDGRTNPWRARLSHNQAILHSPILIVNDRVAGGLLWHMEGTLAIVESRFAAPEFRGGWANLGLLAEATETIMAQGAQRLRFSYEDANADTRKLASRFQATVVSVSACFRREP